MHDEAKMTLGGVLLIVGVLGILLVLLFPFFDSTQESGPGIYCMSNLRSINSAITLYRSANDGAWPWMYDKMTAWDTTQVGANRNINPFGTKDDPNNPKPRSITSLMFLLVRQDQPPGMFRCPFDRNHVVARDVKATQDIGGKASGVLEGEYYWDFSQPENVSYSYQAPIWNNGRFTQGIDSNQTETVVIADMTPAATKAGWKPADVTKLDGEAIEAQNSPNHKGKQVNILRVAGNVAAVKRPDVGIDNDNIYTASGDPNAGSRSATSLDIRKHLSQRDTFLIGPVGRSEAE
jgi:hypothetical protein